MNKVILMGRLTKDVEIRQTPNNLSVARFTIAVNRRFAKDGGQQADFITIFPKGQYDCHSRKYSNKKLGR